jgi:glyoxylase-like metal-dependent hydrolase (beta-lactamase superfamily II)
MAFPTPLVATRQLGALRIHAIQAGGQRLDGGAMFGVVPKVLWQRRIAADERNRIQLGMRCLVIEHGDGLVLVDTGVGNKEDAKFLDIYGIEHQPDGAAGNATALEAGLAAIGKRPEDIRHVINTHLHFDHAGGNTRRTEQGTVEPAFPNATYHVQRGEYEYATHTNERTSASYFPANFEPMRVTDQWRFLDGDDEVVPGIEARVTPGHVPHHQSIVIRSGGEAACFLGDVVPTAHHLPLPWIMGYDVEPLVTLETKRWLLAEAEREQWLMIFEHDAERACGRARHDGKAFALAPESFESR